jgi:hypothetical protein
MNSRPHIKFLVLVAALAVFGAAVAVAVAEIKPNPIRFGGAGVKSVLIVNRGSTPANYRLSVDPPGSVFALNRTVCNAPPHGKCEVRVRYTPSGHGQDKATLNAVANSDRQSAQLIGGSGGGGGGGGGGNGPNCTLHVARHQKLVKLAGGKTVRRPYKVSLTSSETAGNGVILKLKLGRKSENLLRSELRAGRTPKMTLSASCSTNNGATPVSARLRFSDAKKGKGFKLPLEADATVK